MPLKIKIEGKIDDQEYLLTVFFYTDEVEEKTFRFENSSKSFQRNNTIIETSDSVLLTPDTVMFITPKKNQLIETKISIDKSFTYE